MIIWINGYFGSGKSSVAWLLKKRLTKAFIFDPEEAGFYIRKNLPTDLHKDDFQEYQTWRAINHSMLTKIAHAYHGIILVPMTITNETYFKEITEGLDQEHQLLHITLTAEERIIRSRLRRRGDKQNTWAFHQIERCKAAFSEDWHALRIDTSHLSINQVAEVIADISGLSLMDRIEIPLRMRSRLLRFFFDRIWWKTRIG